MIDLLRNAEKILVFTGAGISTGSGISDFRGPQGVWKRHQPVYYQDFMTSETARVEYWEQKLEAWPSFQNARPNDVHLAIADLDKANKLAAVVTQNIDGLHERAGTSTKRLVELSVPVHRRRISNAAKSWAGNQFYVTRTTCFHSAG